MTRNKHTSSHWRPVAVATASALALSVLAGCSQNSSSSSSGSAVALTTVSIVSPLTYDTAPAADSEIQKNIESILGVKLNITWVPNASYNDKMTTLLAGNDLPDLLVVQGKTPAFVQSAQAGAFWDLTDYIKDYPNLAPNTAAEQRTGVPLDTQMIYTNSSINGQVFGIPRIRDVMRVATIVRKDWLEKLNLPVPQTVDDLYNVANAFTNNDPDGNGVKDTYGLIIPKWPGNYASQSPYDVIETWFGAPNDWGVVNGKLVPGFDTPAFLTANQFVKKMVNEGLINPDYATLDSGTWDQPFLQGKGGIIIDMSSRASQLMGEFKKQDPSTYANYVTMDGNLIGPSGTRLSYPTTGYNGFIAIPKSKVPDEATLRAVLSVLDKMNSEQAQIAINNGVEGRNFTVQDGFAVGVNSDDPAIKTMSADAMSMGQIGMQISGYKAYASMPAGDAEKALYQLRLQIHARDAEGTVVTDPGLALVSQTATDLGVTLNTIIPDARIKYYAGQLDDQGLKNEIQRWYSSGGQQVVDEMNDLYQKMNK